MHRTIHEANEEQRTLMMNHHLVDLIGNIPWLTHRKYAKHSNLWSPFTLEAYAACLCRKMCHAWRMTTLPIRHSTKLFVQCTQL